MTQYIYSTHTNAVRYVEYDKSSNKNHNVISRELTVKGGHGLCNKHMLTADGVVTIVKDEELEWLLSLDSFQSDIKKGFIRHSKRKEDSEKVVRRDMKNKDNSAPLTPSEYIVVNAETHSYRTKREHSMQ